MRERLPDDIWLANQKISSRKVAQRRLKIINYIEKHHYPQSRCAECNRKGVVTELTRQSVKVNCTKCKKVWIFKKEFSRAYLPKALFKKPKKIIKPIKKQEKIKKEVIRLVKPMTLKQQQKILDILRGNLKVKLGQKKQNMS